MTLDNTIQQAREQTVQSHVNQPVDETGGFMSLLWMARAGMYISPWWSPARDIELRKFWKQSDHLSGAIYTMLAKMTTIPFKVVARDQANKDHVKQANEITENLTGGAQFGAGWGTFFSQFVEDLLTTDNGGFAEIIGPGRPDGPITGRPTTVAHLDSSRCQRTNNVEYPVIYMDVEGTRYKMHYTRVMYMSQMTSPMAQMNGVGFCATSRCMNVAQTLVDILTFKQEKLGSRPHRAIVLTQGGLAPDDVRQAFAMAETDMDQQNLARYSKIVIAGDSSLPEADLSIKELTSLPDGFDEETSTILGMATIALALGVDARELFPAMGSGATRADALLMHLKQRGKGPGQILQVTEQSFNHKYLPPHLELIFDFQDDAQDRQIADIKMVRASKRKQDLDSGALSVRVVREQMLDTGDLTREQFERIELAEGRLEDGMHVLTLFYSDDARTKDLLSIGVDDPLDLDSVDVEAMIIVVRERISEINRVLMNTRSDPTRTKALQALMAMIYLEKYYLKPQSFSELILGEDIPPARPDRNRPTDSRVRNVDLTTPNPDEELAIEPDQQDQAMVASPDDDQTV